MYFYYFRCETDYGYSTWHVFQRSEKTDPANSVQFKRTKNSSRYNSSKILLRTSVQGIVSIRTFIIWVSGTILTIRRIFNIRKILFYISSGIFQAEFRRFRWYKNYPHIPPNDAFLSIRFFFFLNNSSRKSVFSESNELRILFEHCFLLVRFPTIIRTTPVLLLYRVINIVLFGLWWYL